jgi:hypothetical protein
VGKLDEFWVNMITAVISGIPVGWNVGIATMNISLGLASGFAVLVIVYPLLNISRQLWSLREDLWRIEREIKKTKEN